MKAIWKLTNSNDTVEITATNLLIAFAEASQRYVMFPTPDNAYTVEALVGEIIDFAEQHVVLPSA